MKTDIKALLYLRAMREHADALDSLCDEGNSPRYQFLSFRDPDKNLNLGVCIVEADNLDEALRESWQRGINPGGEVFAYGISQSQFEGQDMELNRLYTREEMENMRFEKINDDG